MKPLVPALPLFFLLLLPGAGAFGLEFSGELTTRVGTQSMTGKIHFKPDRWRVEMASPEGPRVSINRMDKIVTWLLLPNKTYIEIPLRFDQFPQVAPRIEGEVGRKLVGTDQVGGRTTEKYEVSVESEGRKVIMYQWVAPDIKFPMKTATADGSYETAYLSVTIGPQPAHLFEVPAGYIKTTLKP
ncbi:MAG TPA: hypothetical protein VI337_03200 [Nitrospirales bacterium]|nr:hypothetical protein [Nitrospirales bacterium]